MREQQIEEKLKNLPKYSLSTEQRRDILQKLRNREQVRKPKFRPGLSIVFASAVIIFLALAQFQLNGQQRDTVTNKIEESREMTMDKAEQEVGIEVAEGKPFRFSDANQEAIGIEGRVGILQSFDHFVAKDERRVAKLMLYFWDDQADLPGKKYEVTATNGQQEIMLARGKLVDGLYGEDGHALTRFEPFPTKGTWKLSFFIDEKLFAEFTLEVLPPFPATEHFTLVDSPKELAIGKKNNMVMEGTGEKQEKVSVQLLDDTGTLADESLFVNTGKGIDAVTNKPIYLYEGNLAFPKKGTWVLKINGDSTQPFTN